MRYTAGALFLILGTPPPLSIMIGQPTRAPDLGQLHYKATLAQYYPRPEISPYPRVPEIQVMK